MLKRNSSVFYPSHFLKVPKRVFYQLIMHSQMKLIIHFNKLNYYLKYLILITRWLISLLEPKEESMVTINKITLLKLTKIITYFNMEICKFHMNNTIIILKSSNIKEDICIKILHLIDYIVKILNCLLMIQWVL